MGASYGRDAMARKRLKKSERLFLGLFVYAPILVMVSSMLLVASFAYEHDGSKADCAVVLGAAVWNGKPSPVYRERLNFAAELFRRGYVQAVVTTGGIGKGEQVSEGEAGRDYVVSLGVPAQNTAYESTSRTTLQNLVDAAPALAAASCRTILLVSDPLHLRRAMAMANGLELSAKPASTPTTMYRSWTTKLGLLWSEAYYLLQYWIGGV